MNRSSSPHAPALHRELPNQCQRNRRSTIAEVTAIPLCEPYAPCVVQLPPASVEYSTVNKLIRQRIGRLATSSLQFSFTAVPAHHYDGSAVGSGRSSAVPLITTESSKAASAFSASGTFIRVTVESRAIAHTHLRFIGYRRTQCQRNRADPPLLKSLPFPATGMQPAAVQRFRSASVNINREQPFSSKAYLSFATSHRSSASQPCPPPSHWSRSAPRRPAVPLITTESSKAASAFSASDAIRHR